MTNAAVKKVTFYKAQMFCWHTHEILLQINSSMTNTLLNFLKIHGVNVSYLKNTIKKCSVTLNKKKKASKWEFYIKESFYEIVGCVHKSLRRLKVVLVVQKIV